MAVTFGTGGALQAKLAGPFGSVGTPVRIRELTLTADGWKGAESPYFQTVTVSGLSNFSKVDLLPSPEQLEHFRDRELALTTCNEDGVLTVYAIGSCPLEEIIIQAALQEVTV